jgi:release factor glutamine methyltransferase
MSESWTILRLLTWTTDYLKSHGSDSPRLDAEVLLAHARGCERIMLYTAFDQIVDESVRGKFRELVKRRAEGVPVAYLVGKREFYSLSFRVTPDVLIPRPETEFVVVAALDALKELPNDPLVADVGTGSGAIAVAIGKHAPRAKVIAIDISSAALAVAKENAAAHQVLERIEFLEGDLLASLPAGRRFAVIASNPPYIGESEIGSLSPSVIQHEPRHALIAGPTGTEVIERLIPQAAERLVPGGWLILEVSPLVADRVIQQITASGQFEPPAVIKDLAGLPRVVKSRRT